MKKLTNNQIAKLAPAAFEAGRDETRTSDRYHTISTAETIKFLRNEGYHVTDAKQMFAPKKDNRFTRHCLIFTHSDFLDGDKKGLEAIPRIIVLNSNNGTTSLRLEAGFFRFVCANGLIVGRKTHQTRIRHNVKRAEGLVEQLENVHSSLEDSVAVIDQWRKVKLSRAKAEQFALRAAQLRTGDENPCYKPEDILIIRRDEDEGNDLWHIFNTVQENLAQGHVRGVSANGRQVSLRPLTSIRKNTEFNQSLWDLAVEAAR